MQKYLGTLEVCLAFAATRNVCTDAYASVEEVKDNIMPLVLETVETNCPSEGMIVTAEFNIESEDGEFVESDELSLIYRNGKLVENDEFQDMEVQR